MNAFLTAYIDCALWSSTDNQCSCGRGYAVDGHEADCGVNTGGEPLDANYGVEDIASETLAKMTEDCANFQARAKEALAESGLSDEQAGHDFWLTRNGHGAGFWDRGLGKVGDKLADHARVFGSVDLYIGDDGKVYQS